MSKSKLNVVKDEVSEGNTTEVESTVVTEEKPEYQFLNSEDVKSYSDEEIDAKIAELETVAESKGNEMKNKKYQVKVDDLKNARGLYKFLEKNVSWNHQSLPGYVSVIHNLKEAINAGISESGCIGLNAGPVGQIYQLMLQVSGKGYFEAKDYLKILTEVGGGISEAMKELADDNTDLRNIHTDLSTLDTEKTARSQGIKVEGPVQEPTTEKQ